LTGWNNCRRGQVLCGASRGVPSLRTRQRETRREANPPLWFPPPSGGGKAGFGEAVFHPVVLRVLEGASRWPRLKQSDSRSGSFGIRTEKRSAEDGKTSRGRKGSRHNSVRSSGSHRKIMMFFACRTRAAAPSGCSAVRAQQWAGTGEATCVPERKASR
jgi:hypothetical protein